MEDNLTRLTNYLLIQSWQIVVLVIIIAVVTLALKNKSAHVRYLLWLIVLAKCLVPPLLTFPLAVLPAEGPIMEFEPPVVTAPEFAVSSSASLPEPPVSGSSAQITRDKLSRLTTRQWLGLAWIAGVTVFILVAVTKAVRTDLWLKRQRKRLPDKLQSEIEKLFSGLSMGISPNLWLVEGIGQPFVWGMLRGGIYLPANFVKVNNTEHLKGVISHELSHVLRFDAAVNLLQVVAQAIFWFHPLVWWANKRIRAEREKCCDEMAIAHLNTKVKNYSRAIVETLVTEYESTRPVPSLAVAGPVKNIEERIKTMLRPGKKFYKRPSLIAAITILLVSFLTVPTALVLTARAEMEARKSETKSTLPLHKAALDGDINKVRSLISKGADVNEKDEEGRGRTALHCACEKGHAEVARLLISKGAHIHAIGWRNTPLHFAAMSGDKATVELLLSKGADINAKNNAGRTPFFEAVASLAPGRGEVVELLVLKGAKVPALHLAAWRGDVERLRKCLRDGTDINSKDDAGCTALHVAVNSGKKDIVEFLISEYASVHSRDTYGVTPLYYAAIHNNEEIADLLMAKGADANAGDEKGITLLYYAVWDESKDAIRLLMSKGANVNAKDSAGYAPLIYAIWEDDKDMVELLIDNGADVNIEDNDGYTPYYWASMDASKAIVELLTAKGAAPLSTIHVAARAGNLAKVKGLIQEGTDVDATDKSGETPLFSAVLADNDDVAKFLLDKGADVNAQNKLGRTPLHFAIRGRARMSMVELLISKGADVNTRMRRGSTALHLACAGGQKDIVELLITKGADVNARTTGGPRVGRTPLHAAATGGHAHVVELLISKGADTNIKDDSGRMVLHDSCFYGYKDVVELLISKGADINPKDNKGQTALSLAKEQGHEEIVELLRNHGTKE
jgi:ankyrin repeat protein/beta-lactamase regulating signal transducer with metallopeptidase domain